MEFKDKIREILDGYTVIERGGKPVDEQDGIYLEYEQFDDVISQIIQAFIDLPEMQDEEPTSDYTTVQALIRNELRNELKTKLKGK